jgi:hypothetical protein
MAINLNGAQYLTVYRICSNRPPFTSDIGFLHPLPFLLDQSGQEFINFINCCWCSLFGIFVFNSINCLWCYFLFFFDTGSHYVAQAGRKLMILLPQPSESWDNRHVPPWKPESSVLEIFFTFGKNSENYFLFFVVYFFSSIRKYLFP